MYTYKSFSAEEVELKPCPYCGNPDVRLIRDEVCHYVWCNDDSCTRSKIKCFATAEEAIEEWNGLSKGGNADGIC